jgi:acyl-homoserine lactone acylase PvdQ
MKKITVSFDEEICNSYENIFDENDYQKFVEQYVFNGKIPSFDEACKILEDQDDSLKITHVGDDCEESFYDVLRRTVIELTYEQGPVDWEGGELQDLEITTDID